MHAGEELQRGGLAGPVGAEEGHELALLDRQVDAADRLDHAVLAAEQPADRGRKPLFLLIDAVGLRQPLDLDEAMIDVDYRSRRGRAEGGRRKRGSTKSQVERTSPIVRFGISVRSFRLPTSRRFAYNSRQDGFGGPWARQEMTTADVRVGIGHDTHRLRPGGPLRLGGIDIPHDRELVGHSDADVLLHAVTDALLGRGRPGRHRRRCSPTPTRPTAAATRPRCSRAARDAGPRGSAGRSSTSTASSSPSGPSCCPIGRPSASGMAEILEIEPERVGLKAKTGEHVGPIGREEAIAAQCVALLEASEPASDCVKPQAVRDCRSTESAIPESPI